MEHHYGASDEERAIFWSELEWPLDVYLNNGLMKAYDYKRQIYLRIKDIIATETTEEGIFARLMDDFEAFSAFFFRVPIKDQKSGILRTGALYPSPAQVHLIRLMDKYRTTYCLFSRQCGKTTTLAIYAIFYCLKNKGITLNLLAPSEDQMIVMEMLYAYLFDVPYIKVNLVGVAGSGKALAKTHVKFVYSGSQVKAKCVGLTSKGDLKRGLSGPTWTDEWTILPPEVITLILEPLQSNYYLGIELVYAGTPLTDYNPQAEMMFEQARNDPAQGALHVNCWENIEMGSTGAADIASIFHKRHIPCDWGKQGFCGKFYRLGGNVRYPDVQDVDGNWVEGPLVCPPRPDYADFTCDEVCYDNEGFVMEYLAEFPQGISKEFPKDMLQRVMDSDQALCRYPHKIPARGNARVMAIDLGLSLNDTIVLVSDPVFNPSTQREALRAIGWHKIPPMQDQSQKDDPLIAAIQWYFHGYQPSVIFVDATRNESFVWNLTRENLGPYPIDSHYFYSNKTQETKKSIGVWWHGDGKYQMVINHRSQLQQGNWIIPAQNEEFANAFFNEHYNIKGKSADHNRYKVYGDTPDTFDAFVMASQYLDGKGREPPACMELVF